MKKLILFLCFAFTANVFAQKDSLIVLNKDVSINWSTSLISKQQSYFNARFSFEFHNATFKGFSADKKIIKSEVGKSFNYVNHPEGITEYTLLNIYASSLFLKYIKNKKVYTVGIPLSALNFIQPKQEQDGVPPLKK